jgi:hypothetical protein
MLAEYSANFVPRLSRLRRIGAIQRKTALFDLPFPFKAEERYRCYGIAVISFAACCEMVQNLATSLLVDSLNPSRILRDVMPASQFNRDRL